MNVHKKEFVDIVMCLRCYTDIKYYTSGEDRFSPVSFHRSCLVHIDFLYLFIKTIYKIYGKNFDIFGITKKIAPPWKITRFIMRPSTTQVPQVNAHSPEDS